jgi:beta-lactamase regulating signal transducer with metallopeptidase domain
MASDAVLLLMKLNLAAGAAILLVLALRARMRAWFGAQAAYGLWLIVLAALLAVLLPARIVRVPALVASPATAPPSGEPATLAASVSGPIPNAPFDLSLLLAVIWIAGAFAALILLAVRQHAFTTSLGKLSRDRNQRRTLRAEATGIGPALVGSLFPKLVLPRDFEARFDETERDIVLAHEDIHRRGRDPLINLLVALAQCLNWFNPLVHAAAHALRIDQELACDAAVIARFPNAKRRYAEAMLKTQIAPASLPLGCYWPARGEHPLKQRIAMLKRDLPSEFRAACGAVAAGFAVLATGVTAWAAQPPRHVEWAASLAPQPYTRADSQFMQAVWRGDSRRLESAIAAGADVNARSADGVTALAIAARADDVRNLRLLLKHGADPNLISPREGNALAAAARRGQLRSVAALVEHGARVNDIAPGIGAPLAASARTGHFEVVKYLVEHGADVNLPSPPQAPWDRWAIQRTPLGWAVNGDHIAIANYLRSKGATM